MKKEAINNPRYPHMIKIVRYVLPEDEFSEEEMTELIIYEGVGRGYTDTTTNGNDVDVNKRKASIPMRYDEWGDCCHVYNYDENGDAVDVVKPYPMDGDILVVDKGNVTEEWKVRDFEPDNDRSIIYAELNRNIGA